jgi:hypothetical protein
MTESDVRKFQDLFEKESGENISLEEAWECAQSLVDMIRLIYKPIKKKGYGRCTIRPDAL